MTRPDPKHQPNDPTRADDDAGMSPDDRERRAALAKLGALGAWTAPTVLTLLASRRASAESLPGTPPF